MEGGGGFRGAPPTTLHPHRQGKTMLCWYEGHLGIAQCPLSWPSGGGLLNVLRCFIILPFFFSLHLSVFSQSLLFPTLIYLLLSLSITLFLYNYYYYHYHILSFQMFFAVPHFLISLFFSFLLIICSLQTLLLLLPVYLIFLYIVTYLCCLFPYICISTFSLLYIVN